jgi:sec-independent protein translocase protein TatA
MPFGISWVEILILLLVALLVFGPKRLPEMGRSLGRGLREFKDSVSGRDDRDDRERDRDYDRDDVALPRASEDERISATRDRERDANTVS